MKYLLDTHVLLWAAAGELSELAAKYIEDESNELYFSSVSIWEVVIKSHLNKRDFYIEPLMFYQGLLSAGYIEVPVTAKHAIAVERLPNLNKDPFDRMLIAQAISEELIFLTADELVKLYTGPIIHVS
jgi:PIN domain nuclease of toxin-antitoxin system